DRFFYRYGEQTYGDIKSPVHIAPEVRSDSPQLDGSLDIVSRAGCDIAPVDVRQHDGAMRLRSYVWPDQTARLERLDGAIQLANSHPYELRKEDAADFVANALRNRP